MRAVIENSASPPEVYVVEIEGALDWYLEFLLRH